MAKLEKQVYGDFHEVLNRVSEGILDGSVTAMLEDASDFCSGSALCSVRVFERYGFLGGNRLSLSITLFQGAPEAPVQISAVAAGGSQAMFFKINTLDEEAFLDKLRELI